MPLRTYKKDDGKVILTVHYSLDSEVMMDRFRDALQSLYDEGEKDVVLDLNAVDYIDSDGIGEIVNFNRIFEEGGGRLYLGVPLKGFVGDLFRVLMLDEILKEYQI